MRVCIDGKFKGGLPGQATAAAAADRDSFGERVHSTYTTGPGLTDLSNNRVPGEIQKETLGAGSSSNKHPLRLDSKQNVEPSELQGRPTHTAGAPPRVD